MVRSFDASTERFLNDLARTSRRIETAQREITSGKRLNSVSDDPNQISSLFESRALVERTSQLKIGLGSFKTEVDISENTLQQAVENMEKARVLASQGSSGEDLTQMRLALARKVEDMMTQMVSLANTSLEGRYVFAGDSDQAAPYTIDLTQSSPISPYGGSPSTRQALHPSGYTFSIARTADEIFDNSDPTKNVLSALNNLRVALQSDSDQGVKDALTNIETASTHLNQELAFYGSAQNQIDGAIEFSDRKAIQLRQQLAGVEEADTVQAILDLQNARLSYEAALGARARLPNKSLFDYLA